MHIVQAERLLTEQAQAQAALNPIAPRWPATAPPYYTKLTANFRGVLSSLLGTGRVIPARMRGYTAWAPEHRKFAVEHHAFQADHLEPGKQ